MHSCIIIDDDIHSLNGLCGYIDAVPNLKLVKSFSNPLVALTEIPLFEVVDILFLDVEMPLLNGIDLAKELFSITKKLVFTTAHTKYAFDAFEIAADAYLLKPYTLSKFIITTNKLFSETVVKNSKLNDLDDDFFFVKSKNDNLNLIMIRFSEIVAIESKLNYLMIHTSKRNILTYMSIKEISYIIRNRTEFMKVNRSFILNINMINSIDGYLVKMTIDLKISIGDQYKVLFKQFLSNKLLKADIKE